MDITKKLEEARKCINQALIGLGRQEKEDVFEIRIPNLRPDETEFVQNSIKEYTEELLNKLIQKRLTNDQR